MAFRNTLLEEIEEMPDLSRHWLYNFNTLRDKNESVTETNKIEQFFFRAWFCKLKPPYSKKLENFIKMG